MKRNSGSLPVDKLLRQTERFFGAMQEELGVDEKEAKNIWYAFSYDMMVIERLDMLMEGAPKGLWVARCVKKAKSNEDIRPAKVTV